MKTIGILGHRTGIDVDYYRLLIAGIERRRTAASADHSQQHQSTRIVRLVEANDFAGLTGVLVRGSTLERAGAALWRPIRRTSLTTCAADAPSAINIVEGRATRRRELGLARPGLFGTRFTMHGGFYQEVFSRAGMEIVVPAEDEQDAIHHIYMDELVLGDFRPASRERLLAFAAALKARTGMDGLLLGGTERARLPRHPEIAESRPWIRPAFM